MNKKLTIALLAVTAVSFLGQLLIFNRLPEIVPIHWNLAGEVDNFGSKYYQLFLSALPFLMIVLLHVVPKIDPKKQNYQKHGMAYGFFSALVIVMLAALSWVSTLAALGYALNIGFLVSAAVGILFIVLGNFLPQIRPNYSFGLKSPWTLANEDIWRKTHRAAGIWFVLLGSVYIGSGFGETVYLKALPMVMTVVVVCGVYGYSYWLFRKIEAKQ